MGRISMKVPMVTWRKRVGGIFLAGDVSGSQNGEDGEKAETGREEVGVGVCGHGDWVGAIVVVTVDSSFDADAVEGAIHVVL